MSNLTIRPLYSVNDERETMSNQLKSFYFSAHHSSLIILLLFLFLFTVSVCLAQDAQTPRAETRPATSNTGTITGHVSSDEGRPITGAVVHVIREYSTAIEPGQAVSTDDEGNFSVTGLSPGLYSIIPNVPGFVNALDATTGTVESRDYRLGDTANITLTKGGVITGAVRDANGEPVVATVVRAIRVRDGMGRSAPILSTYAQARMTDDRGIYRLYGLTQGTYIVSAGGSLGFFMGVNAYDADVPTYYPSSTRDTAAEVSVRSGDEVNSIDIRYRGEHGHTVSGTINNTSTETGIGNFISLTLRSSNGIVESNNFVAPNLMSPGAKPSFSIQGVGDGVYDLIAQQGNSSGNNSKSAPRRITVKGADVTGIELTLAPLGSIAGRATLEPAPKKEACAETRPATLIETVIRARSSEKNQTEASPFALFQPDGGSIPTDKGEFTIRNLNAGTYRMAARLPGDRWYIRSIVLPGALASNVPTKTGETKSASAVTPSIINLKAGENFTGVTLSISQDGATLSGRIGVANAGAEAAPIPSNLRIYLVPSEKERADDTLRYAEVKPDSNGTFTLKNLAPGRYWIIARALVEDDSPDRVARPLAWDADARGKLRRDAEAANISIELQPCQSVADYVLKYPAK